MTFKRPSSVLRLLLPGLLLCWGTAQAEFDAAGYYQLRCGSCHGVDGEGTDRVFPSLGPALRGNALVQNAPDAVLIQIIRRGRSGKERVYNSHYPNMPAFGVEMVPDVEALVTYLKGPLQN